MKRVFLEEPLSERMRIGGETARHIGFSLRMAVGDALGVADPHGRCGQAVIEKITSDSVWLQLVSEVGSPEPPVQIWLAQGLTKGDKFDFIVEKAVELGAAGIIPLESEHSIVRYSGEKRQERVRRWQKISLEAAQQSGRGKIPLVEVMLTPAGLLSRVQPGAVTVALHHGDRTAGLSLVLKQAASNCWMVMIGPEGGWSKTELRLFQEKGVQMANLGPRVLRAETAAVAVLSAIQFQLGDLGGA